MASDIVPGQTPPPMGGERREPPWVEIDAEEKAPPAKTSQQALQRAQGAAPVDSMREVNEQCSRDVSRSKESDAECFAHSAKDKKYEENAPISAINAIVENFLSTTDFVVKEGSSSQQDGDEVRHTQLDQEDESSIQTNDGPVNIACSEGPNDNKCTSTTTKLACCEEEQQPMETKENNALEQDDEHQDHGEQVMLTTESESEFRKQALNMPPNNVNEAGAYHDAQLHQISPRRAIITKTPTNNRDEETHSVFRQRASHPKKRKLPEEYADLGAKDGQQQGRLKTAGSDKCSSRLQQVTPTHGSGLPPPPHLFEAFPPALSLPSPASRLAPPHAHALNDATEMANGCFAGGGCSGGAPIASPISHGIDPLLLNFADTFLQHPSSTSPTTFAEQHGYTLGDPTSLPAAARSAMENDEAGGGDRCSAISPDILLDPFPALARDYISAYTSAAADARRLAPPPDRYRLALENGVREWLEEALPYAATEDVTCYAMRLVEDGFDCEYMLERELLEEDLSYMKKAHRRILVRTRLLAPGGPEGERAQRNKDDDGGSESGVAAV